MEELEEIYNKVKKENQEYKKQNLKIAGEVNQLFKEKDNLKNANNLLVKDVETLSQSIIEVSSKKAELDKKIKAERQRSYRYRERLKDSWINVYKQKQENL